MTEGLGDNLEGELVGFTEEERREILGELVSRENIRRIAEAKRAIKLAAAEAPLRARYEQERDALRKGDVDAHHTLRMKFRRLGLPV